MAADAVIIKLVPVKLCRVKIIMNWLVRQSIFEQSSLKVKVPRDFLLNELYK